MKVYKCNQCGNIISMISASGVPVMCCGKKMEEMVPNTVDASAEKHVPVVEVTANKVEVVIGEVQHPMAEEHYIEWIVVEYPNHYRTYHLNPNDEPKVKICGNCDPINMYAYCNIHGLWEMDK